MAVEDMAMPAPATAAVCQGRPASVNASMTTARVPTTCSPPSPNKGLRKLHTLSGSSSRPTRNNSSTTPNSAKCKTCSGSVTSLSTCGPIKIPAIK